jgi:hypothetical protein
MDASLVTDHKQDMIIHDFNPSAHKFALEVRSPDAWFKVQNTLGGGTGEPAYLTIEYMITSPDCMYPEIVVHISSGGDDQSLSNAKNTPKVLGCIKTPYKFQAHISHQVCLSIIPPGESIVGMKAKHEQDQESYEQKWPFRVILALS